MSDFNPRPDADPEWQALMHQLRTQSAAQPRPFFYGRVQARLAAEVPRSWLPGWVRRPAYAVLLGALVLALSGDDPALGSAGAAASPVSLPGSR